MAGEATKFGLRPRGGEGNLENNMRSGYVPLQLEKLKLKSLSVELKSLSWLLTFIQVLRNSSNVQSATKMEKSCVLKHRKKTHYKKYWL
ncbi:hypothetical protein L1887_11151 [Cichorium endivia]|nr:hypothetical protein L1887_11151 [Cichorium endivia]